ncbi:MAG: Penicillin-binding protein 2 [candidate division TM6 bacterium GW2011_GWE2_41_16]|nr:MAG: Penicillin-binding protein 2 [candidate division TM6 bacterium GW2011_GWE2_41_16]
MISQNRARSIKFFVFFITAGISLRLVQLQTHSASFYQTRSIKNYLRFEKITSLRGEIVDCNGVILATNEPITSLWWHGSGKNTLSEDQKKVIAYLAEKFHLEESTLKSISLCERFEQSIIIQKDIILTEISDIVERFPLCQNIELKTSFKRCYPYKESACHLIGYLGSLSAYAPRGVMGLEKACEQNLKGIDGIKQTVMNSFGKRIHETGMQEALCGESITTTINFEIQKAVEEAFGPEFVGAAVVMCPKTGAIRALISRPTFDPHIFLNPLPTELWNELQEQKPFMNRALEACIPPGSIFKLVTASAALETKLVSPSNTWHCNGTYMYAGSPYRCNKKEGHGTVDFNMALTHSCNIAFFDIGRRIPIDTLANYAHRYGLGEATGIILPEKHGLIPTREWKMRTFRQPWWPGETLSAAIGQSYVLLTPLQIARMVGGIIEGYLVKPRILERELIVQKEVKVSAETRAFIKRSMRYVVSMGSARSLSYLTSLELYGKTGTSQVANNTKSDKNSAYEEKEYLQRPHGCFVVYVKNELLPPLVMVVFVEHAGSSSVATGIAKKIIQEVYIKNPAMLFPKKPIT